MEIALVYREIQQLLIENENVTLPKVGQFAIVAKSATFLEDCKAILPPNQGEMIRNKKAPSRHGPIRPFRDSAPCG